MAFRYHRLPSAGEVCIILTCTIHHTWCLDGPMSSFHRFHSLNAKIINLNLDTRHWTVLNHL